MHVNIVVLISVREGVFPFAPRKQSCLDETVFQVLPNTVKGLNILFGTYLQLWEKHAEEHHHRFWCFWQALNTNLYRTIAIINNCVNITPCRVTECCNGHFSRQVYTSKLYFFAARLHTSFVAAALARFLSRYTQHSRMQPVAVARKLKVTEYCSSPQEPTSFFR